MKAAIAIDSFKGSLSTIQAGNAAKDGIMRVYPDADVTVLPLADGGEGTVRALIRESDEKLVTVSIYAFASRPAVLYARAAYCCTLSAESLNSVSTPPTSCSYSA